MGNRDRDARRTKEDEIIVGNDVFEAWARAIGLDAATARNVAAKTLASIGTKPTHATIDEIGALLPELDRHLRLLVPPDIADRAMTRVRRFVLTWE